MSLRECISVGKGVPVQYAAFTFDDTCHEKRYDFISPLPTSAIHVM